MKRKKEDFQIQE